jgi:putative phosphoesterase
MSKIDTTVRRGIKMRIAVLSDSHDNIWNLKRAMPHLNAADAVIHCGDIVAPFVVSTIAEGVGDTPVHLVWGNNEGDKYRMGKVIEELPHVSMHGAMGMLQLEGINIAFCHFPHVAEELAQSGHYGMVCYGHSHKAHEEWVRECLLLNPGEVMGMRGPSTMALVDLPERSVEWIDL